MNYSKYIFLGLILLCIEKVEAQFYNLPNNFSYSLLTQKRLAGPDSSIHSGIQPYIPFFNDKYKFVADSYVVFKFIKDDPALDLVFYDHLVEVIGKKNEYTLRVDPILNFQVGRDLADSATKKLTINTRGVVASATIGKDFYCESMFVENQGYFPSYINQFANSTEVIPGQGRYKVFKKTGYDYAFSSGFISYQPSKNFNLQLGHGKQKIGYGYRSLLLSDNSFNYPYLRLTQQWFKGRVQYTNIYAVLMNLDSASKHPTPNAERLFQKKPAAFQYLSINLSKRINMSLFQGVIWETGNGVNKQQVNWMYANPVIYSQLLAYGWNNKNNVVAGGDIRFKITNQINLYGQCMLDDLSSNKSSGNGYGYQIGFNYFDAFEVENLFLFGEYNSVSKSSYNSPLGTVNNQSYSHYSQNLAYTPNAGNELVLGMDYKAQRMQYHFRYHYQTHQEIVTNFYDINFVDASVGYLINPSYNLNFQLGYNYRYQKFHNLAIPNPTTSYLYFGLKTNLYNVYNDF